MWLKLLFYTAILVLLQGGNFELISDHALATASMKSLVEREGIFISELTNYTTALKKKIETIESFLKEVQSKRDIYLKNPEAFVAHPLHRFSLIRRLYEDWTFIELYMSQIVGLKHIETIIDGLEWNKDIEMDMEDAGSGMAAMQRFHDLNPTDTARGIFLGRQYNASLNSLGCLYMANIFSKSGEVQATIDWNKAALQQFDKINSELYKEVFNMTLPEIYFSYANALFVQRQRVSSVELLREVSDSDARLWYLKRTIEKQVPVVEFEPIFVKKLLWPHQEACLGLLRHPTKNLSCFYDHKRTSFLQIAPLKVEILNWNPYIAMYHEVIYSSEIFRVKNNSLSSLKGPLRYSKREEYSLKSARVIEQEQSMLNLRIRDITGQEVKEDKDFYIYNYGLGGFSHYHLDNINRHDQKVGSIEIRVNNKQVTVLYTYYFQEGLGDRLTTIMFFLSVVDEGGALIFSSQNFTVWPRKGSALVFHNMDNALQPDIRLLHMSCPVIVGSKWTLVKWLHKEPQVFVRPCKENYDEFIA
ncbi:hypothetical protein KR018_006933 [Drosophila ironensis]|nr:hypothetical protein KR018_006933 [Drosophila ironensis]